jgi:hypothetical protein
VVSQTFERNTAEILTLAQSAGLLAELAAAER